MPATLMKNDGWIFDGITKIFPLDRCDEGWRDFPAEIARQNGAGRPRIFRCDNARGRDQTEREKAQPAARKRIGAEIHFAVLVETANVFLIAVSTCPRDLPEESASPAARPAA